jgi:hypothetical protein
MAQPSIDEALLELAASHATGSQPIQMLFLFSLTEGGLATYVSGAVGPLMLRGVIAQIHDILAQIEDDHLPDTDFIGSVK